MDKSLLATFNCEIVDEVDVVVVAEFVNFKVLLDAFLDKIDEDTDKELLLLLEILEVFILLILGEGVVVVISSSVPLLLLVLA